MHARSEATEAAAITLPQLRVIPRSFVTLLSKISAGSFGTVWKATVEEPGSTGHSNDNITPITYFAAAKLVLETAPYDAEDELVQEARMMASIPPHRNIVGLVGIVEAGDAGEPTPILLVQFCEHASLKTYLVGSPSGSFSVGFKLAAGRDIASGMAHLCRHGVIHRDLAARNVLVDSRCTTDHFPH